MTATRRLAKQQTWMSKTDRFVTGISDKMSALGNFVTAIVDPVSDKMPKPFDFDLTEVVFRLPRW